jgi:hypothetical protein
MHKKSIPHYTDNVDLVRINSPEDICPWQVMATRNVRYPLGEREIICFPQASSVTKNRFNITEPLPFTFDGNPFSKFLAE